MSNDIQLSGDMAKRVEEVLQGGADRLIEISRVVGSMADEARLAHDGSATAQMEENYRDLQKTGITIASVIERLGNDFDVTVNTGMSMQDGVTQEMARAADGGGGGGIDPQVARAI